MIMGDITSITAAPKTMTAAGTNGGRVRGPTAGREAGSTAISVQWMTVEVGGT